MQQHQELLEAAITYTACHNQNITAHVRRVLKSKFQVDITEIEIESACGKLASRAVIELAGLVAAAQAK